MDGHTKSRFEVVCVSINGHDEEKIQEQNGHHEDSPPEALPPRTRKSSSSYWSRTFGITTLPLILCGSPTHLMFVKGGTREIKNVRGWLRHAFNFRLSRASAILSSVLLLYTVILNLLYLQLVVKLFEGLFISGKSGVEILEMVIELIVFGPKILATNYVWLYGFKIRNLIETLDKKHAKYGHVRCEYKRHLAAVIVLLVVIYASRQIRNPAASWDVFSRLQIAADDLLDFSNYVFFLFIFPIYCTFCFGIRFELLIIKDFVYDRVANRATPCAAHMGKIKVLFTHAADHIVFVNEILWALFGVVILIMVYHIVLDADELMKFVRAYLGIAKDFVTYKLGGGEYNNFFSNNTEIVMQAREQLKNPEFAKKLYMEIIWELLTLYVILFTIWQAIVTNDCVRELQNWLNDFLAGGGGSKVETILKEVRVSVSKNKKKKFESKIDLEDASNENGIESESEMPLMWAGQKKEDGEDYEDMFMKISSLKNYIVLRMKLEHPALLCIMWFGSLPLISSRLQGYKI